MMEGQSEGELESNGLQWIYGMGDEEKEKEKGEAAREEVGKDSPLNKGKDHFKVASSF